MIPIVHARRLLGLVCLSLCALPAQAALDIQHWQTDKGIDVYFVPVPDLPMLDVQVTFDAGSARDGEHPGLARLTAGLLDEGSGDWDADAVAARFEDVGANYANSTKRDRASVSLRTLSEPEFRKQALDTFIRVMTEPSFPERAFDRARQRTLVKLRDQAQNPQDVASKAFSRAVFGDHPYAHPVTGTEASIKAMTRAEVRDFHKRYYVAANATLAIVGDVERAGAETLAARIDEAMRKGEAPPPLPEAPKLKESRRIVESFPSEQAHVYVGQPGIARGAPDYFPLYVGNHVLGGGGFNSRLVKRVRVQRGLAYSVYSYFIPREVAGPFLAGLQTRADQAHEAADVVRSTLREFIDQGPTSDELQAAKQNIVGGFALRIDSNRDVLGYLSVIGFYDLPLDYLDTFNEHVEAVDQKAIQAAFRKELSVDRMVTVIVGGDEAG